MKKITIIILTAIIFSGLFLIKNANANDNEVYQIQKKLKALGYDPGSADGVLGSKTRSAIKRFQRDNGLPVTGKIDGHTRTKILNPKTAPQLSFAEAIKKDDIITVRALIAAGTDVNARDELGETPLHMAAVRGFLAISSLLINEGADVNARDNRQLTPLHAAAWTGHEETALLLIEKGADINARGENGITPLHVSALSGSVETIGLLIRNGADINAANNGGITPLHAAALSGQQEAVELLIRKGADVNATNREGLTPLQLAIQKGHQALVQLFRKYENQ